MAIEVFNRYENKYLISDAWTLAKLQSSLSDYMEADEYNRKSETYKISNLYYDTDNSLLICTSLGKPNYKEKLRLRAYGVPDDDSKVYIEIKKKVGGLVNKRRSSIKLPEAYTFLETGVIPEIEPYMNTQVLREVEYFLRKYKLKPQVYISYDRMAYFSTGQHDVRVSFDSNILTRRTDLQLEAGSFGSKLLPDDTWLMEVKVKNSIPVWLLKLLSEYSIYPVSFSKYGAEYRKAVSEQRKRKIYIFLTTAEANTASDVMIPSTANF